MAERTLLRNAKVLACSGDPTERPADGDILIEGGLAVDVDDTWHPVLEALGARDVNRS